MAREHWGTEKSLFEQRIISPSEVYSILTLKALYASMRKDILPKTTVELLNKDELLPFFTREDKEKRT